MADTLNTLPADVPIGTAKDADGNVLQVMATPEFLRAQFAMLRRVGGTAGLGSDDLAALIAFEGEAAPAVQQFTDVPPDVLATQVAELTKLVVSLQRQLAAIRDPAPPVERNALDDIRKEIALIPDYSGAVAQLAKLGTMSKQNASAVAITGGAIDNTAIGSTTRSTGRFSTVGIGTGSPVYRFVVSNNGGAGLEFDSDGTAFGAGTTGVLAYNRSSSAYVPLHVAALSISFRSTNTVRISLDANGLGFFGATPIAKPNISGSRGGNAALASLLTNLAALGLVSDGTTA